jgi:hypothetical protein
VQRRLPNGFRSLANIGGTPENDNRHTRNGLRWSCRRHPSVRRLVAGRNRCKAALENEALRLVVAGRGHRSDSIEWLLNKAELSSRREGQLRAVELSASSSVPMGENDPLLTFTAAPPSARTCQEFCV